MAHLTRAEILEHLKAKATNSSHFVWLLADLKYFQSSNGWIFGYQKVGRVTLLALEPLRVGSADHYTAEDAQAFAEAWRQFVHECNVTISAFVSVYEPFMKMLGEAGFSCVKVGSEPWVDLKNCIPTGNAGKGVRNARNKALNAGLTVEEWSGSEIEGSKEKQQALSEIYSEWRSRRTLEFGGFLNSTNPLESLHERRYFVVKAADGDIEAYLIAAPVPGREGYFLEDLISRKNQSKGAGELITLEAMVRLGERGAKEASLGVVSMSGLEQTSGELPSLVKFLMIEAPKAFSLVYNFNGMSIYRKRFKPHVWRSVHLGVGVETPKLNQTWVWMQVLFALVFAFSPRLNISRQWAWGKVSKPFRRTPFTAAFALISGLFFAVINHFGPLPDWALSHFGFFGSAPSHEWMLRSVMSDFLYFDVKHFVSCAIPLVGMMYWAERTHRRSHFLATIIGSIILDDFVNYWVLVKPFQHFQPTMFSSLMAYKDVGGSLTLALLVGVQVCQFRVIREPLVAVITLVSVLAFAFTSPRHEWLIMNLNHAIFFVVGFLLGKADFEYRRHLSRLASKAKPPEAKTVLPPRRAA